MEPAWVEDVLGFWFGLTWEQWWRDQSLDGQIRDRFGGLWEAERQKPADDFLGSPREALGAVILFDQFPRNMFRDTPKSFESDALALAIARQALDRGYDKGLTSDQRTFLYIPFQHSERLSDQQRCVELLSALDNERSLEAAKMHRDVIERFGRFPHRNPILGRAPTAAERAAGDVVPW